MNTAKLFKNFSDEDFTWKFDGIPYTFKAGQEIYLEDFKAEHFAKHLIDRELTRAGIQTNMQVDRDRLAALCFPSTEVVTPDEALDINEKVKAAKKKVAKKKKVEEFEDLED